MPRAQLLVAAVVVGLGCTPDLGDVPFACAQSSSCPDGYVCRAELCVREGLGRSPVRAKRVTWLNASEMFWLPRAHGGAALVINDGFSEGRQGLYEILAAPDGTVEDPRLLRGYSDEFPRSSAVVALDERRYAVVTLSFPPVDSDTMALEVFAIEREAPPGAAPSIETLFSARDERYLGGIEPTAISAVAGEGRIDVAWTRPSAGGSLEVMRLERDRSVWTKKRADARALPSGVLPLSGDCLIWPDDSGELTVRLGFGRFAIAKVDANGTIRVLRSVGGDAGVPLFAFGDRLLSLRRGDAIRAGDGASAAYCPATYAISDLAGRPTASWEAGVLQQAIEPYTATAFEGGALVAPLSDDPLFPSIGVGWIAPDGPVERVASVARSRPRPLYSARALGVGDKVYLAWTELLEGGLDLWVAVADLAVPGVHGGGAP